MSERIAKAAGFNSFLMILRQQMSVTAFDRLLASLPPQTRALHEKPPMPMEWIEQEHFDALIDGAWEFAAAENEDAMVDLSRRQMSHDMSTIYKVLMHMASTETVLKKSATIYSTYTHNGRMIPKMLGPKEGEIRLEGLNRPTVAWWAYMRGAIVGVLEAAGTKNAVVRLKSGGGLKTEAVFGVTWD